MKTRSTHRMLPLCLGVALLGAAGISHAAVGARVLLQEWSPLTPQKQSVRVLANDSSAVSDAIQKAWSQARPVICAQLKGAMGKGGAAGGQTLYDIDCQLDQTPAFSVATAGSNGLTVTLSIGGYVAATSTTPTALGSYADPRFSLALKANMVLTLAVQPNPDQLLRVDKALFTLSDATIDSHNFTGDVLKFVADDLIPFFHGPNYKRIAENAINGVGIDVASRFNAAFAPVNALLRGPSGAVRVGVWGKADAITIAFGPRELTPPSGGTVSGALRWEGGKVGAPANCDSFSIGAMVQTGPAPLLDPSGYVGEAPRRALGSWSQQPGANGECRYRMTGLAAGWPNEFSAHSSIGANKSVGNSLVTMKYEVVGDGWDGHIVVPQPSAERNYVVKLSLGGSAVMNPGAALKGGVQSRVDPRINPVLGAGTQVLTPMAQSRTVAMPAVTSAGTAFNRGATVSLNPQPLPPGGLQAITPVFNAAPALMVRGH